VREALEGLAEEYRNALVLKEIEGLPYEEIAVVMDCPVGTVRSRIHRARHELRDKLTRVMKESDL
jgi:RNA polymerase sigma-70 factor (ECF subfamily)